MPPNKKRPPASASMIDAMWPAAPPLPTELALPKSVLVKAKPAELTQEEKNKLLKASLESLYGSNDIPETVAAVLDTLSPYIPYDDERQYHAEMLLIDVVKELDSVYDKIETGKIWLNRNFLSPDASRIRDRVAELTRQHMVGDWWLTWFPTCTMSGIQEITYTVGEQVYMVALDKAHIERNMYYGSEMAVIMCRAALGLAPVQLHDNAPKE